MRYYRPFVKNILDFVIALIAICCLSPLFLSVSVFLYFAHNGFGGIIFLHSRIGKNGKSFKIIKFKTMNDKKGIDGRLLPDEVRLTKVGRIIRILSIDELPQFFNILKGDMALIGPRPLPGVYLPLYTSEQQRRHDVKPGIVGWAGVNGRNNNTWQKKLEMDVWYVDHLSFMLDLKIFLLAIWTVLSHKDVSKDGFTTTEPFNGKN